MKEIAICTVKQKDLATSGGGEGEGETNQATTIYTEYAKRNCCVFDRIVTLFQCKHDAMFAKPIANQVIIYPYFANNNWRHQRSSTL